MITHCMAHSIICGTECVSKYIHSNIHIHIEFYTVYLKKMTCQTLMGSSQKFTLGHKENARNYQNINDECTPNSKINKEFSKQSQSSFSMGRVKTSVIVVQITGQGNCIVSVMIVCTCLIEHFRIFILTTYKM